MSVKSSQSGARVLAVLEAIAAHQPIGLSALAREVGADKSAIQRSLATLAETGWIRSTAERPVRWELSARLFTLARRPHSSEDLRARARPILEDLRERTGETAFLAIPDRNRFVIIEAAESHHVLRISPRIGQVIQPPLSATSRAFLSFYDPEQQTDILGRALTDAEAAEHAATRTRGYALSVGEIVPGSTNVAAPIFDSLGRPAAALAISGPSERITADRYQAIGQLLRESATALLRGGAETDAPGMQQALA